MKKTKFIYPVFVLVGLFYFNSCITHEPLTDRSSEIKTLAIDFREYADKGFLFMPDEYFGEYEVKGIITAELHPRIFYRNIPVPPGDGYTVHVFRIGEGRTRYSQVTSTLDMDELIEYIYNLSMDWGGDAFTHFESKMEVGRTDENPNTRYVYYSVSGIVIKRH